jgi:hypothetical protein
MFSVSCFAVIMNKDESYSLKELGVDLRGEYLFYVCVLFRSWFCKRLFIRDPRLPDFGRTVPILGAVFRVPPGYMAGHTFVPLFETFGLH